MLQDEANIFLHPVVFLCNLSLSLFLPFDFNRSPSMKQTHAHKKREIVFKEKAFYDEELKVLMVFFHINIFLSLFSSFEPELLSEIN
jgi:hypothetical protein